MSKSNPDNLKSKHRTMMEDMVFDGLTAREVCAKYDMTEARFSLIKKSPLWVLEERELRTAYRLDRTKQMEALLPHAIKAFETGVKGADIKTAIMAGKEICDRAGMARGVVVTDVDKNDPEVLYETLADIQEEKKKILEELGVSDISELRDPSKLIYEN